MGKRALLIASMWLLVGALSSCLDPGEAIADKAKDAAFGSANDKACDEAGDVTRSLENLSVDSSLAHAADEFSRVASELRALGSDAEGDVKSVLARLGDSYQDAAISLRAGSRDALIRATGAGDALTQQLADLCGGYVDDGS